MKDVSVSVGVGADPECRLRCEPPYSSGQTSNAEGSMKGCRKLI